MPVQNHWIWNIPSQLFLNPCGLFWTSYSAQSFSPLSKIMFCDTSPKPHCWYCCCYWYCYCWNVILLSNIKKIRGCFSLRPLHFGHSLYLLILAATATTSTAAVNTAAVATTAATIKRSLPTRLLWITTINLGSFVQSKKIMPLQDTSLDHWMRKCNFCQ